MKRIYFFCSLLLSLLLTSCGDYDDSAIQNKLNDFKERITALQTKANKLNEDISKLSDGRKCYHLRYPELGWTICHYLQR